MVLVGVGVLYELDVVLLQSSGQQHRVLVVHVIVRHAVVQHPLLVPEIFNPERRETVLSFSALSL